MTIPPGAKNVPVTHVTGFTVGEKVALGYGTTSSAAANTVERYEVATVTAVGKPGTQAWLSADAKNDLVVVMAIFSIVAGVRAAYAYKKADKELIKQYRYMQRIFGAARDALDRAADANAQRAILRLLGDAALAEQVEWALMHRQRPLEHNRL